MAGAGANYLLDHTSLQMVPNNPHWKSEAQARIEQIRKANINIRYNRFSNPGLDSSVQLRVGFTF